MMLLKKILHKFNGLHYKQDYLCFAKEQHAQPLNVYLVTADHHRIVKDITNLHLFVGYHPLIFAFLSFPELTDPIRIIFSHKTFLLNESFSKRDALACLDLKLIKKQEAPNAAIVYYEGIKGSYHFLSPFHQMINNLSNRLFNKQAGNVFLHDNLYTQVQIAYAVPRIISLITVSNGKLFNLFPTDLHGQVTEDYYIISLRTGGKAAEQVVDDGKLLLSEVNCGIYKTVYALGKNHMQKLKLKDGFPFSASLSEKFNLPVPEQTILYRELELLDSFTHGIHTLLLFRITSGQQLPGEKATLAHIHNSYASWRYKNGLRGNYLLR